jgi:cytochrome d ubiquinol oxidase subunit II
MDLPDLCAGVIAFAVFAYVALDGFDLGVGILLPFIAGRAEREDMLKAIAPVWDGNETWLVMGGGGLLAFFPLGYAIIMPALYVPIITMLLALVLRGVAFEFRAKTQGHHALWDHAFAAGSMVAAFAQGSVLGALVQGIAVDQRGFSGAWSDWLTLFSMATGGAVVVGYALLGATWLIVKTEGPLQQRARNLALVVAPATLLLILLVSVWTPFVNDIYRQRWVAWPRVLVAAPVPLLLLVCAGALWRGLTVRADVSPFLASLGLFLLCYAGLGISLYPDLALNAVTIAQAAAPRSSLTFLLVGAAALMPLILGYTFYSYWTFRGKIGPGEGYE